MKALIRLFAVCSLAIVTGVAQAAIIGNWDGSGRSWNSDSILADLMTSRGHTVEADGALTAANLANDTLFVIGEATRATTAQETTDLLNWITGGGRLLVTVDSGDIGAPSGNSILSALGSSLNFGGTPSNAPLQSGNFLTEGGPFDIVGESLQVTPGTAVNGGTSLAGSYVAYDQIGAGFIFGFGDHFHNDFFNNSASNVNGQMHINLVESGGTVTPVPAPGIIALLGIGLAAFGFSRRNSRRTC